MDKIIQLINVDKKEKAYLAGFGVKTFDALTSDQGNQLFILIIKDFKNGILSLDELSVFGFKIFHGVAKKYPQSDLFPASLSVSELNFAVRAKAVYENIVLYLKEMDNFLEKYQ